LYYNSHLCKSKVEFIQLQIGFDKSIWTYTLGTIWDLNQIVFSKKYTLFHLPYSFHKIITILGSMNNNSLQIEVHHVQVLFHNNIKIKLKLNMISAMIFTINSNIYTYLEISICFFPLINQPTFYDFLLNCNSNNIKKLIRNVSFFFLKYWFVPSFASRESYSPYEEVNLYSFRPFSSITQESQNLIIF
jgi:hypothetical protein